MSNAARQMADQKHNFIELHGLWKQGRYTVEECITQILHTLIRFEKRRLQVELKLLHLKLYLDNDVPVEIETYETVEFAAEAEEVIAAMEKDESMTYKAVDYTLEHFAALEIKFIQIENEVEFLLLNCDTTDTNFMLN